MGTVYCSSCYAAWKSLLKTKSTERHPLPTLNDWTGQVRDGTRARQSVQCRRDTAGPHRRGTVVAELSLGAFGRRHRPDSDRGWSDRPDGAPACPSLPDTPPRLACRPGSYSAGTSSHGRMVTGPCQ